MRSPYMSNLRPFIASVLLAVPLVVSGAAANATVYFDGVSPPLSGAFDLGTHLPNYIGSATGDCGNLTVCGSQLDGVRVYMFDVNDHAGLLGPSATANFNLL